MTPDLIVIHEHPEWQKPIFAALETRGVRSAAYDLKRGGFDPARVPFARVAAWLEAEISGGWRQ